jgi:rhodanese-related sulfurtransferase
LANHLDVPGINVQQLAMKQSNGDVFILLDVREAHELVRANLGDRVTAVPLSLIAQRYEDALPGEIRNNKDSEIVVMCHHGIRSAQVTAWMGDNGFRNVWNLDGGIEAYAVEIDSSVGRY